jgi:hypothetical protein
MTIAYCVIKRYGMKWIRYTLFMSLGGIFFKRNQRNILNALNLIVKPLRSARIVRVSALSPP